MDVLQKYPLKVFQLLYTTVLPSKYFLMFLLSFSLFFGKNTTKLGRKVSKYLESSKLKIINYFHDVITFFADKHQPITFIKECKFSDHYQKQLNINHEKVKMIIFTSKSHQTIKSGIFVVHIPLIFCFFIKILQQMQFIYPIWCVIPINITYFQQQSNQSQTEKESYQLKTKSSVESKMKRWDQYLEIFQWYLQKKSKKHCKKVWSKQEDDLLLYFHSIGLNWFEISQKFLETNQKICKRRFDKLNETLERWPKELDNQIKYLVEVQNQDWQTVHSVLYTHPSQLFPRHSLKQLKERYLLNLMPGIINEQWTIAQDLKLLSAIKQEGTHWRKLTHLVHGRTQLQLKNRYYGTLKPLQKKVIRKLNSKNKRYQVNSIDAQ